MKYSIEKTNTSPAYLQLYRQLRDDIIRSAYPFGTKLPSKRLLADETGVSIITIEHAYALLCEEGYAESRERSGYYVCFRPGDGFAAAADTKSLPIYPDTITPSLSSNRAVQNLSFPLLARTMRKVLSDYGNTILEKSPNEGISALREEIRKYLLRSRGIIADNSQIIIGSGSEYLYGLTASLLGREKVYAIEAPSYHKIQQVYESCDVTIEMLPLGADGIESTALQNTRADILHITPYRSFPSGVTASASKRHEYLRWADKENRYIIEDDYESEFSVSRKAEETLFAHAKKENVIYMNTFSNTISPALRVAYMVLPASLVSSFEEKLGFYSCTVPTFEQYVLSQLLASGDFERHINRVRRQKRKEKRTN
ncbi:MAG: PLP-dependent aminotransferase family protein [Lachnospiraceae bacterium]|nr:PLP-dependent aminotransferase family protein [Lachnospiraceae bacterium]